jgi:hypothetical protein
MALWFAVIRIREMMQKNTSQQRWVQNRWSTRAQTERRFSINLDDAFAEQWQDTYG